MFKKKKKKLHNVLSSPVSWFSPPLFISVSLPISSPFPLPLTDGQQ